MTRLLSAILSLAMAASIVAQPHASSDDIERAIVAARTYLISQQRANGGWAEYGTQPGGQTALATYALLASGVPSTEPHLRPAIKYLENTVSDGTYALGLRCQVWYQLFLELDPDAPTPNLNPLLTLQRYVCR